MDSMYNFANNQTVINQIETAASDVVEKTDRLDITFAEGECEPMTVTTRSGEYTMVHVQDVSVQFQTPRAWGGHLI